MARDRLDGRLVTRCDGCGQRIRGSRFIGAPGLSELLGIGFCPACGKGRRVDFVAALLNSNLLSEKGRQAVLDGQLLQAPKDIQGLEALLRGQRKAGRDLLEGRDN